MLSEFECGKCQTKFVAAFMEVRPGFPIQHCVACGSKNLKYLGSNNDDVAANIKGIPRSYDVPIVCDSNFIGRFQRRRPGKSL